MRFSTLNHLACWAAGLVGLARLGIVIPIAQPLYWLLVTATKQTKADSQVKPICAKAKPS